MKATAKELLALLRVKHHEDVFVSECKDGPSQMTRGHLRLDALVMNRSWTNACVTGYEIKVSRSDFLNDKKWPGYLGYCNQFTFVCPSSLIQPEEVGPECGLMWASKTGNRLYTKKKAPYRTVPNGNLESVFRYILMCRANIRPSQFVSLSQRSDEDYWRAWMEDKEQKANFGHYVSKRIREIVERDIDKVQRENDRLGKENELFADIQQAMVDLGLVGKWDPVRKLKEMVQARGKVIPQNLAYLIERATKTLADAQRIIDEENGNE